MLRCIARTQTGGQCLRKARYTTGCCRQHHQILLSSSGWSGKSSWSDRSWQVGGGITPEQAWKRFKKQLLQRLAEDETYKLPDKTTFETLAALPENFEKADVDKKYLEWIITSYLRGGIQRYEDLLARLEPALKDFGKLIKAKRLNTGTPDAPWSNEADINNYCGLSGCKVKRFEKPGLEDLLDKHRDYLEEQKKGASQAARAARSARQVFDGEEIRVVVPLKQEAACYYGQGTRWCTAASRGRNMFRYYDQQGPLYIVIPKNPTYKGEKYQLHLPTRQFMNEKDESISLILLFKKYRELFEVPELKDFLTGDAANILRKSKPDQEDFENLAEILQISDHKAVKDLTQYLDITSRYFPIYLNIFLNNTDVEFPDLLKTWEKLSFLERLVAEGALDRILNILQMPRMNSIHYILETARMAIEEEDEDILRAVLALLDPRDKQVRDNIKKKKLLKIAKETSDEIHDTLKSLIA